MKDEKRGEILNYVAASITEPVKPLSYMRPAIDLELEEPEVDLEFKAQTFRFMDGGQFSNDVNDQNVTDLLNIGWQIDDKIVCPPFAMLILSREKEEKEVTE